MRQYFTKTGIELKVIQGEGLGDGIPSGLLRAVNESFEAVSSIFDFDADQKILEAARKEMSKRESK